MEKVYIDGELAYQIWRVSAQWIQDGEKISKRDNELPEGKFYNGTGYNQMYKDYVTKKQVEQEVNEWWQRYSTTKLEGKNTSDLTLNVEFLRYETWCIEWFNHYTYDSGQTNQEALISFEKFVRRMEDLNQREGKNIPFSDGSGSYWQDSYCLMGAEDRWRWSGGDSYENKTDPPCRCGGCKKAGIIRINH